MAEEKLFASRTYFYDKLKLLLLIRVSFVTLLLSLIAFLNYRKLPDFSLPVLALYGLVVFAYFVNILFGLFLKRFNNLFLFKYLQLLIDSLFVTTLIYVTGGSNSLLNFLYIFLILEGGYIDYRRGSLIVTLMSMVLYGGLIEFEFHKAIPYLSLIRGESPITDRMQLYSLLTYNFVGFAGAGILWGILSEQLKIAHRSLKSLEDLTRIVFRRIPSGIITITPDGLISAINEAAENITGLKRSECYGREISKVFPGIKVETPQTIRNECRIKKKEGQDILIGYSVGDLGESGKVIIFQDLTEEKKIEEEMKRSEHLAALGRLSAGLAHEMRTIVSSISASSQLLRTYTLEKKEMDKLLKIIINESKRLNELVSNFLNFTKPERNMNEIVSIDEIVKETLDTFHKNNSKHVKFITEITTPETKIRGSREGMRQVFSNLVLNAIDAVNEGGEVRVQIRRSELDPGSIEFSIADNGCGIPEDVLPHIFEPFFTTKANGAGIGLATVFRVVEAHGGRIEVSSKIGEGTMFRIFLPLTEVN